MSPIAKICVGLVCFLLGIGISHFFNPPRPVVVTFCLLCAGGGVDHLVVNGWDWWWVVPTALNVFGGAVGLWAWVRRS